MQHARNSHAITKSTGVGMGAEFDVTGDRQLFLNCFATAAATATYGGA